MSASPFQVVPDDAELLFDRQQLEEAIDAMGLRISADLATERVLLMTVMHGGLPFAARLTLALTLDVELDYVHASRYRGEIEGGQLHWKAMPSRPLEDRDILLADDILDEGHTLVALRDYCLAQGARSVRIAVLCEKRHERRVPGLEADYVGVEVPDRYVFGYGMDVNERYRQLPGIYAKLEASQ